MQKKQKQLPEHKFLLIDTIDRKDGSPRRFIVERTTALSGPPVVDELDPCPSFTKKAKKFVSSLSTIIHTPPPSSESSHARELDHLSRSFVDKSTLSVTRSVDFVSDSLNKVEYTEAFDVIAGENSIRRQAYSSASSSLSL